MTGETITEDKLNHMEDGIGSGEVFYLTYDEETNTYSHTVQECKQAMSDGKIVVHTMFDDPDYLTFIASLASDDSDIIYFYFIAPSLPDIVIYLYSFDGVSFSSVTSEGGITIPQYYTQDIGKVLTVVRDESSPRAGCKLAWTTP